MPVFIAFIVQAGWQLLGWLVRTVVVKFVVATIFYFVISGVMNWAVGNLLPSDASATTALGNALSSLPPSIWYVLDLLNIGTGLPLLLSAVAARFAIKFIPKL